jgi:hypothetical protein
MGAAGFIVHLYDAWVRERERERERELILIPCGVSQ